MSELSLHQRMWSISGTCLFWNVPPVDSAHTYAPNSIYLRSGVYTGNAEVVDRAVGSEEMLLSHEHLPILLEHDASRVVGRVTALESDSDGLVFRGWVLPKLLGNVGEVMLEGLYPGVSVCVTRLNYAAQDFGGEEPLHCKKAILDEISLVWKPAFKGCRVETVEPA